MVQSKEALLLLKKYLPVEVEKDYLQIAAQFGNELNEIRIRVGKPVVVMLRSGYRVLNPLYTASSSGIAEIFERLCDYSVYSRQAELSQGFLSLPGGHRVGVCGTAARDRNGNRTVHCISSLNIRIAHECIGCSEDIVKALFSDGIMGILLVGPPCSGKTTLLRDIGLKLSSQPFMRKVVLVDERAEMAAMYRGEPQNTLGMFCDVLSEYPKGEGMLMAVRTLAPDVIICDEIGGNDEADAIIEGLNSGVSVIASIHAGTPEELYHRPVFHRLKAAGAFEKIAFLKGGSCRGVLENIIEVKNLVI